jgi:hypothetical protein
MPVKLTPQCGEDDFTAMRNQKTIDLGTRLDPTISEANEFTGTLNTVAKMI